MESSSSPLRPLREQRQDRGHSKPFRKRRWARTLLVASAGACTVLGAAIVLLLRDPLPRFHQRRSRLVAVDTSTTDTSSGYVTTGLRLRAESGLSFGLLVREPLENDDVRSANRDPISPIRRPLFLILGGYETGQRAASLVQNTRGAIVVAFGYPYTGRLRLKGLQVLPRIPALRRAILDTPPAVLLALDCLLARDDVDPARVELVGASFGVPFATIAAALDPRVTRLWLVHGAGRPRLLIDHNLRGVIPFAPLRFIVSGVADVLASGPRLAPERWVPQVAPRPLVMINAEGDERLPREAVEALYAAAHAPKQLIWLPGPHVQVNRQYVVQALVDTVLAHAGLR